MYVHDRDWKDHKLVCKEMKCITNQPPEEQLRAISSRYAWLEMLEACERRAGLDCEGGGREAPTARELPAVLNARATSSTPTLTLRLPTNQT